MGLNDSYFVARGQILSMEPIPLVNEVYSLLAQEEKQRLAGSTSIKNLSENMAMVVKFGSNQKLKCSCCGGSRITDKCYKLRRYLWGRSIKITRILRRKESCLSH